MRLAICIPSRGMIHSRTLESVFKNVSEVTASHHWNWKSEFKLFFTHDLPIPDAPNKVVSDALDWGAEWVWFVEEDMLIPDGALLKMLEQNERIVAIDYPVGEKRYSTQATKGGQILWCGLGCTLIHKAVLESFPDKRWFRTDQAVRITDHEKMEYEIIDGVDYKYGGHDILFGIRVRERGFNISSVPEMTCGHIRISELGRRETNKGVHAVDIWDRIENYQQY